MSVSSEQGAAVKANTAHAKSGATVVAELAVDPQKGLSEPESATRRASVGPNSLPAPKRAPLWRRIASQISNPIVLTLLAAAVISVVVGARASSQEGLFARYGDAIAILLIVLLNAVLGLVQELKAESAVSALAKLSVPRARVRREGRKVTISAVELVPGDILELEAGDAVPADARLLEVTELLVEEASLTGESLPVKKDAAPEFAAETPLADRVNMLFLGTAAVAGRGIAVVTATGARTELGRIGTLITSATKETTPLEAMLERFGRRVLVVCLALSLSLFLWGLARPWLSPGSVRQPWHLLLLAAVSLAVAAIPEGLPAITTITLALGTQRLAKRGAIVRHLPAVETLGAATFICTDKTGTLTQNAMMARSVWTLDGSYAVKGEGYAPEGSVHAAETQPKPGAPAPPPELLIGALVCNHADLEQAANGWRPVGDPTEAALVTLARRGGLSTDEVRRQYPIVQEIPFESARKRMTVVTEADGKRFAWMKGAFDVVLDHCTMVARTSGPVPLAPDLRATVEAGAEQLAQAGLRVLAIAYRAAPEGDVESGLTFLGLVGLLDPPRTGVSEAIKSCQRAGIAVAMITGDHPTTATAIAKEIGVFRTGDVTMTGAELDALSDGDLRAHLERARVFARTSPEQKLRIVRGFKALGHIVAMTGDGVNDAPALREAHIGVAMGRSGTEVARQAADIVLADDDFSTIVHAIREGRVIYRNIRKFIFFLLAANAGLCGAVFLAALIADWPPYTPLMLLWINLVTNGLPALALGIDPMKEDVMATAPRKLGEPLLLRKDWIAIGVVGVVMTATSALFHVHGSSPPDVMLRARALGFTYLALGALLFSFSCTSTGSVIFKLSVFRRPLTLAVLASAAVHALAVLVPPLRPIFKTYALNWVDVTKLSVACLALVPALELWKWLERTLAKPEAKVEPKPEAEAKAEPKPGAKPDPLPTQLGGQPSATRQVVPRRCQARGQVWRLLTLLVIAAAWTVWRGGGRLRRWGMSPVPRRDRVGHTPVTQGATCGAKVARRRPKLARLQVAGVGAACACTNPETMTRAPLNKRFCRLRRTLRRWLRILTATLVLLALLGATGGTSAAAAATHGLRACPCEHLKRSEPSLDVPCSCCGHATDAGDRLTGSGCCVSVAPAAYALCSANVLVGAAAFAGIVSDEHMSDLKGRAVKADLERPPRA